MERCRQRSSLSVSACAWGLSGQVRSGQVRSGGNVYLAVFSLLCVTHHIMQPSNRPGPMGNNPGTCSSSVDDIRRPPIRSLAAANPLMFFLREGDRLAGFVFWTGLDGAGRVT